MRCFRRRYCQNVRHKRSHINWTIHIQMNAEWVITLYCHFCCGCLLPSEALNIWNLLRHDTTLQQAPYGHFIFGEKKSKNMHLRLNTHLKKVSHLRLLLPLFKRYVFVSSHVFQMTLPLHCTRFSLAFYLYFIVIYSNKNFHSLHLGTALFLCFILLSGISLFNIFFSFIVKFCTLLLFSAGHNVGIPLC